MKKKQPQPSEVAESPELSGSGWEVKLDAITPYNWKWWLYEDGNPVANGTRGSRAAAVMAASDTKSEILHARRVAAMPKVVRL